jgi:hypothetical protein
MLHHFQFINFIFILDGLFRGVKFRFQCILILLLVLYTSLLFAYIAVGYEWHLDEIVKSE